MNEIIISLFLFNSPEFQFDMARNYSLSGDYERSNEILLKLDKKQISYNDYNFYMAVNYFKLNDKKKAENYIKLVEDSFLPVSRRHKDVIHLMAREIKDWKQNDLSDIGRDMGISGDRLQQAKGGKRTQEVQKEIINKIDKFIKDQEEKQKQQAKANSKPKNGDEQEGKAGSQNGPAQESQIANNSGQGKVDDKKLRQIAENWGKLPPQKRAEATQELTRDLPPKYKAMIEEYFKSINKFKSSK
jgi:hypothetical protein